MTFTYRLLGKDSKLDISVEPKNMNRELIWLVNDPQEDTVWKTGNVSLGLVTEFRVNKSFPFLQSVKVHVLLHFIARDHITWKSFKLFVTSAKPGLSGPQLDILQSITQENSTLYKGKFAPLHIV